MNKRFLRKIQVLLLGITIVGIPVVGYVIKIRVNMNIKEKAIIASKYMVNDIMYDINRIQEYYYNPTDGVCYTFLNIDKDIYDKNEDNDTIGKYRQYSGDDFINKINEVKTYLGEIVKYEIIEIKYTYDIFRFEDYGYPHGIFIDLKVYYNNIILNETIYGYYIKETDKIGIVSYYIDPF